MANVEGKCTAITVLTPVQPGGRIWLALVFFAGRHITSSLKKLQMLSFIHFAHWSVVTEFPDGGDGERLGHTYLLFESNFNGTWDQYIDAFSEVVPTRMKAIWGTSYGFPGPLPVEPFKAYIRKNEYLANHYWSAYPDSTTTEVVSAARVTTALDKLVARSSRMSAAEFEAAYRSLLTELQRDL